MSAPFYTGRNNCTKNGKLPPFCGMSFCEILCPPCQLSVTKAGEDAWPPSKKDQDNRHQNTNSNKKSCTTTHTTRHCFCGIPRGAPCTTPGAASKNPPRSPRAVAEVAVCSAIVAWQTANRAVIAFQRPAARGVSAPFWVASAENAGKTKFPPPPPKKKKKKNTWVPRLFDVQRVASFFLLLEESPFEMNERNSFWSKYMGMKYYCIPFLGSPPKLFYDLL